MITKPPPYESAPTLSATHASVSNPPPAAPAATSSGQTCPAATPRVVDRIRPRASSTTPQPSRTSTSPGPRVPAARAPTVTYAIHQAWAGARRQLEGARPPAAWSATAATAAPEPALAPSTQVGGEAARNSAERA